MDACPMLFASRKQVLLGVQVCHYDVMGHLCQENIYIC